MRPAVKPSFFYGYWISAAGLLSLFIMSEVGFYAFGIFFKPIQEEFGWGRGETSAAIVFILTLRHLKLRFASSKK